MHMNSGVGRGIWAREFCSIEAWRLLPQESKTMNQENHPAPSPEREALRARHGVRAISSVEEGHDVKLLPTGIYGFTAAPAAPELPLFVHPIVRSTEVHN